ncbi:hypothetical protein A7K94_0212615 [Modestobacter sp. VKM Ac-2676]|nr:hypothetical protein A7K94_0212615 [Modestobacter sp. VKM Ac-2676]
MFLITCPVTRATELVADRRVRSVVNHPSHIAMTVACPCGAEHVYRTGRRWEAARNAGDPGGGGPAAGVGQHGRGSSCAVAHPRVASNT